MDKQTPTLSIDSNSDLLGGCNILFLPQYRYSYRAAKGKEVKINPVGGRNSFRWSDGTRVYKGGGCLFGKTRVTYRNGTIATGSYRSIGLRIVLRKVKPCK